MMFYSLMWLPLALSSAAGTQDFSKCSFAFKSAPSEKKIHLRKPLWAQGLERVTIHRDSDHGQVIKVSYPRGGLGPNETGAQWVMPFVRPVDQIIISYDVKFDPRFQFVKGGKLPGVQGGGYDGIPYKSVTGGRTPDGKNGFSVRMMWHQDGRIVQYVYHPDKAGVWGEDMPWKENNNDVHFMPGNWQNVRSEIILNDPGKRNGVIRSWLDGKLVLERTSLRFRDISDMHIDAFLFSTFFGGNTPDWSAVKDEGVSFSNFSISN